MANIPGLYNTVAIIAFDIETIEFPPNPLCTKERTGKP